MPGLVPGIHAFLSRGEDVDGRDEPGHDDFERSQPLLLPRLERLVQSGGTVCSAIASIIADHHAIAGG
jgi:hypothetical protein